MRRPLQTNFLGGMMKNLMKTLDELKAYNQWVCYQSQQLPNGKTTKIPIDPNKKKGTYAKVSDSSTWGSFDDATNSVITHGYDGVGFVLTDNDPFVGIDIDNCIDPKTGEINADAMAIIKSVDSYTEKSPSRLGIRIFAEATLPIPGRKVKNLEIYYSRRFLTITGDHYKGTPLSINPRQQAIDGLFKSISSPAKQDKPQVTNFLNGVPNKLNETLNRALQSKYGEHIKLLLSGDNAGFASTSEGDLALCKHLAFWFGKDAAKIDAVFRCSRRFRTKWDERHSADGRTYGEMTVQRAIASTKNTYKPGAKAKSRTRLRSKRKQLSELLHDADLFHSKDQIPYATVDMGTHFDTFPLESEKFKVVLEHLYFKANGTSLPESQYIQYIKTARAKALFMGRTEEIYLRVAAPDGVNGNLYIDLLNNEREVVVISKNSVDVKRKYSVKFHRPPNLLPLPHPDLRGSFKELKKAIAFPNVNAFRMISAWLLGAVHPTGPYPPLILLGSQGSAKSTVARFLKSIVDPSLAPLRTPPTDERNLAISTANSKVLVFDNLSFLYPWFSDALCRLSTGGGFTTRKLYTDSDEVHFEFKQPVILTSISILGGFHDLVERSIFVNLDHLEDTKRLPEDVLMAEYDRLRPRILGAVCVAASEALNSLSSIKMSSYPRMADFARWICAAEAVLPWKDGRFTKSYKLNRKKAIHTSIESDVVAAGIVALMKNIKGKKWWGTVSELMNDLEGDPSKNIGGIVSERIIKNKSWPKLPHIFSRRMKQAQPALRKVGIRIEFKDRKAKRREILIRKK
jgi:hypothetical protein